MGEASDVGHEGVVRVASDQVDRHDVSERIRSKRSDEPGRPRRLAARRRWPAVGPLPFVADGSTRLLNGRDGVALGSDHSFPAAVEDDEREGHDDHRAGDRASAAPEAVAEGYEAFPQKIEGGKVTGERMSRRIGGQGFGRVSICAHHLTVQGHSP